MPACPQKTPTLLGRIECSRTFRTDWLFVSFAPVAISSLFFVARDRAAPKRNNEEASRETNKVSCYDVANEM